MIRLARKADLVWQPWKNGGGVAADVAVAPDGAGWDGFDWRVSLARVERAGAFSVFPDTVRGMLILDGGSLALDVGANGKHPEMRVVLDRASPAFTFAGDVATVGTPAGGTITNLNVMVRRDAYLHRMVRWRASPHAAPWVPVPPGGTTLVHIERGEGCAMLPACPHAAHAGDTFVTTEPICLAGLVAAEVIEISIWRR